MQLIDRNVALVDFWVVSPLGQYSKLYKESQTKRTENTTMKTYTKYLAAFLLALCIPMVASAQQNNLTQTTLSASVAGGIQGQGTTNITGPAPTLIQVASATGIVGINPNLNITASQANQSAIFVDRELMLVIAVNGTQLTVARGINGTVAAPHLTGAMVLVGKPIWFYAFDPGGGPTAQGFISNVSCTLANVVATPWVNIRSGAQWYCNPTSLTWQPGFNNPLLPTGASFATVASAAGAQAIPGPVSKISGTNAITSFTFAGAGNIGLNGAATANTQAGGQFCIIPTGAYTTTATNNIGAATTAIVGIMQCWYWNGPDAKWYPTR